MCNSVSEVVKGPSGRSAEVSARLPRPEKAGQGTVRSSAHHATHTVPRPPKRVVVVVAVVKLTKLTLNKVQASARKVKSTSGAGASMQP
jgi:hypothetical protein